MYGCHRTTSSRPTRRARRLAAVALTAAAALLATACQGSTPVASKLNSTAVSTRPASSAAKYLQISPAPGSKNANPSDGITVTALQRRQDQRRDRQDPERAAGHRDAQRERDELAQHVRAAHRAVLHGDRHRDRRLRPPGHRDQHVHHADAVDRVPRRDLRGGGRHLRGGHADHADVRPPDHGQGGRRAGADAHHVQAGGRRVVLGRQRAARLPAEGLLARRHDGQLLKPPGRRGGRAGRVRGARPLPDVQHRPVGHRGSQHE